MRSPQPHRIKHLPTGLFYRPSSEATIKGIRPADGQRRQTHTKTNLSKTGKVYNHRPTLKHVAGRIYNHVEAQRLFIEYLKKEQPNSYHGSFDGRNKTMDAPESDWMIEKFENNEWVPA